MDQRDWIEYVINRFSRGLIRYSKAIVKDQEVAKELVQDCLLKLLENDTTEVRAYVQAWLYRECRNRSIDYWRRQQKSQALTPEMEESLVLIGPNQLDEIETRADIEQLRKNIGRLSAREQEIVWLKFNDGLSYKEIAEVMSLTPTNVGFILSQAVTRLRDSLKDAEMVEVQVGARKSW